MSNTTSNILRSRLTLRPLKLMTLLGVMMVALPMVVEAQTDRTGTYYIGSAGYNANNYANNYYLCPTEGWIYYKPNNDWTTDGDTYPNPFLTTFKCRTNAYHSGDASTAVWVVKQAPAPNTGYYYIIHAKTGQYMVSNGKITGTSNANRMRVHLETVAANNLDEKELFSIETFSTYLVISPKSSAGWNGSNYKWYTVNGGNQDFLVGNGSNGGPTGYTSTGGILGLYTQNDVNAKFYLEQALSEEPSINFSAAAGSYNITWNGNTVDQLPDNYVIRYTEDGSDPVTDPNGTAADYDGSTIAVVNDGTIVNAVVMAYGVQFSQVATQTVNTAVPVTLTFGVTCDSKLQITCDDPTATISIYYNYTTDGTDPADPDNSDPNMQYTEPVSLPDGAKVKAVAYVGNIPSQVSDVYEFYVNTPSPVITLNETEAIITFEQGVTIHYTTSGTHPDTLDVGESTSPFTITGLSYDADVVIHVIGTSAGHKQSCPVTVAKRPKQPTIATESYCFGETRVRTLSFSDTEVGKTYWYTLSNGAGQSAPDPNTSSAYIEYTPGSTVDLTTVPTWNGSDVSVTIHACAKTSDGYFSHVVSEDFQLKYTDTPTITYFNGTATISATTGATIHYTVDGGSEQTATTSVSISLAIGQNHTITAWAQLGSEGPSCETYKIINLPTTITTLAQLNGMSVNGSYVLGNDISGASSHTPLGTDAAPFTGSFDGGGYTISGLTQPLFGTTNNAVVHDVNLKLVDISNAGDTVGAVACVAKGYTRVYNCGILPDAPAFGDNDHPSVVGGKCAGGIVGSLRDDSRVVNCFSYADVTATGMAAGIVGRNQCPSDASVTNGKYTKLRTMVVNCIFYGDIHTATYAYPVYGGKKISNKGANGINNYNFYSDSCSFKGDSKPTDYYCSWPAKYEYLTRYEFHRYLLNSNRELCGWWVGAPSAPSTMSTLEVQAVPKDASLMAKWVLDRSIAPFPILKPFGKYSSPINIDADASWRTTANPWEGKKLGTLSVTIQVGDHGDHDAGDIMEDFAITDMDTLHGDFCYRKIQLPYYNSVFGNPRSNDWSEKYAKNYGEFVVTGWEISGVTGGTAGTLTTNWETGYNYADRNCTVKDLYSTNDGSDEDSKGRVFAQGGYYYVPNGVTAITITAHWAKAYYLGNGDLYYDRVDFDYLLNSSNNVIANNCTGSPFAPAGQRSGTLPNGETLLTGKIADVAAGCTDMADASVYDYALVLVGNHQYCTGGEDVNPTKSFTIMSADFDMDDEPDYCLEWQLGKGTTRQNICPIRFDFLPVVEIGLALKKDGSKQYYSLGCYHPRGHFEVTETALIRFGQFEFGYKGRTKQAPLILNGGIYEQYVKGKDLISDASGDKIIYKIIGGNVYMPSFTPGAHVHKDAAKSTRHCAVNVIGGRIDNLYLTGNYNEKVTPNDDDPHCYIDGGWFDHVASAGKEGIGNTNANKGNVTFKINHARIKEFYGGGTMARPNMIVKGNIEVTVDSSRVYKYCGGPKFGNMNSGKTVTTQATNTFFGVYYGGGNGGTNYIQYDNNDGTYSSPNSFNWATTGKLDNYTPLEYYSSTNPAFTGYKAKYELEMINVSTGTFDGQAVNRTYLYVAQYSATDTGPVSNTLNKCIVKTNFYGAGNLGGVNGNVTSVLTDTEVKGSAFGAGFSAQIPKVTVDNKDKTYPYIDLYTGSITPPGEGTHAIYTWTHDDENGTLSTSNPVSSDGQHLYTEVELVNLGMVTGNVTLTLKGTTKVGTSGIGHVYGGGDESKVTGNVVVRLQDDTEVSGDVFGGGNRGEVDGSTTVTIGTDE